MYDSVQVFAVGLRTLEQSHALRPANISCELEHPWDGGLSLINYINSVSCFERSVYVQPRYLTIIFQFETRKKFRVLIYGINYK